MEQTLATRISDFLKHFPPFDKIPQEQLRDLAGQVQVLYLEPQERLYRPGDKSHEAIYVVRQGAIQLSQQQGEQQQLIDLCDEGDVLGLRPLFVDTPYEYEAMAQEESLLYSLPVQKIQILLKELPGLALYMAKVFAGTHHDTPFGHQQTPLPSFAEIAPLAPRREPVVCHLGTSIKEAAAHMTQQGVGSILIVDPQNHPLGIITDKDFRRHVSTGKVSPNAKVDTIMSSPVITIPPSPTVADVQIAMVRHRVHHLCITQDGTVSSPVQGVLSEHDLLVTQSNNPAVLIRSIQKSTTGGRLKTLRDRAETMLEKYLEQDVSITFSSSIISAINDSLINRCIQIALEEHPESNLPAFCWLSLGSEGRKEQLLRTDQDNALVFADVAAEELPKVRDSLLKLSRRVTELINEVGFEYCPAEMMASNPKWCQSLSEWKQTFAHWIDQPTPDAVMFCTIFFDFRSLFGDEHLAHELSQFIFKKLDRQSVFLVHLAKNALQNPPPLGFFRNFLVEKSGQHRNEFDIKRRAMMPLVDAARTLVLYHQKEGVNNTIERFQLLAELEPQNAELYQLAAESYGVLMQYRARQGLRNADSGRFVNPEALSKLERLTLRNTFRPISDLQQLLTTRFQLGFMR
jgi:CBS domain-containing protein